MKLRESKLAINLSIVNTDEDSLGQRCMATTFRHEGLSIGQDYLRLEGSTISRGELQPAVLDLEQTLGRGNFSRVIKATWTKKNGEHQPVALKQFPLHSDDQKNMLAKELNTLGKVDCECLVKLIGAFMEGNSVTIALEFMDKGSLEEVIPITKTSEQFVSAVAYQMLWGLSYLHFEKMIHRDVKPGNVLLNSAGQVKLSDFGIACSGKEMSSTVVGTTLYMAPERLLGQEYGSSSDVWSMGLVLWLSATGVFPFQDITSWIDLTETIQEPESIERLISCTAMSEGLVEIIKSCLQRNRESRIPASLLLRSPWFALHNVGDLNDAVNLVQAHFGSKNVK